MYSGNVSTPHYPYITATTNANWVPRTVMVPANSVPGSTTTSGDKISISLDSQNKKIKRRHEEVDLGLVVSALGLVGIGSIVARRSADREEMKAASATDAAAPRLSGDAGGIRRAQSAESPVKPYMRPVPYHKAMSKSFKSVFTDGGKLGDHMMRYVIGTTIVSYGLNLVVTLLGG